MMKLHRGIRFTLLWIAVIACIAGCDSRREPLRQEQFFAFGTLVEISLFGTERKLADRALAAAEADFQRMHEHWHAWHPSAVTGLNHQIAAGRSAALTAELLDLTRDAQYLSLQSNGLFNPAIGRLIRLWGFQQDDFTATRPPDSEQIRALVRQRPGMDDLTLTETTVSSRNPAVQLDFGAIAKGYGIDRVIEHLQSLGVHNAIVNCGGDLRAIGSHGERPWRIGIRKPRGAGVLASLQLGEDESVFTSGDYERYFDYDGERYHHILDPRNGYPARGLASVTVVHSNAATADAAATAIFVAGPEDWQNIARRLGIRYVMLVDRQGVVQMNPAMAKRIQFEAQPPPELRISEPL